MSIYPYFYEEPVNPTLLFILVATLFLINFLYGVLIKRIYARAKAK